MCDGTCGVSAKNVDRAYEASDVTKAPSLPQIVAAVERTDTLVTDIERVFDFLSTRLTPVSLFATPPTSVIEPDDAFRAPLADAIEHHNERLVRLRARIADALQALEV